MKEQRKSLEHSNSLVPLMERFAGSISQIGIKNTHFLRVFNDGKYFHFSNKEELNLFYIKEIHDTGKVFKQEMQNRPNFYIWPTITEDPLIQHVSQIGFAYGITFYTYAPNYFDAVSFSTSKDYENIINQYVLNFSELRLLASTVRRSMENHTEKLKNASQYQSWSSIESSLTPDNNPRISPPIYSKNGLIEFTKREWDCFRLLGRGKSTKEISNSLGLSTRTIETYFNRMKKKSGERYLSGLVELFHND